MRTIGPGNTQQARQLAEQRWHTLFPFDLDPQTWDDIFRRYDPRDILAAITTIRDTHSPRPDVIYSRLLTSLETLTQHRTPTWPPFSQN
jgi:hypothetical protein